MKRKKTLYSTKHQRSYKIMCSHFLPVKIQLLSCIVLLCFSFLSLSSVVFCSLGLKWILFDFVNILQKLSKNTKSSEN